MSSDLPRRRFLSIAAGGAAAGSFAAVLGSSREAAASEFGPLVPDPDGILDLPEGFSYRILERQFEMMDDGYRVPASPDAMAVFEGAEGTLILMRNHEVSDGDTTDGPYVACLLYTSPSPRDLSTSRMPSSA